MHLLLGFIDVMIAQGLAVVYRMLRFDFIGRRAVRCCCAAYRAGAGLDEAAMAVLMRMGPDAGRLLEAEVSRHGQRSIAARLLHALRQSGHL